MIVVIDYGMGNLGSIINMLKRVGAPAQVSCDRHEIEHADKLILPGVGAFDTGMRRLAELDLINLLNDKVLGHKTPTFGVCLGMQLLLKRSEEGDQPGLGWVDGEVIRFRFEPKQAQLKIPHMGWNTVTFRQPSVLFAEMESAPRFYFVHSYHAVCHQSDDVIATTEYGYAFASAIQHANIVGVQFHPEKSHRFGMQIYRNFVERM